MPNQATLLKTLRRDRGPSRKVPKKYSEFRNNDGTLKNKKKRKKNDDKYFEIFTVDFGFPLPPLQLVE